MKKITIIICILSVLFSAVVMASDSEELSKIESLLANGTIENYETILIPLRGNPEDFNIKPGDDLKTLKFGKGVEGYSVDFEKLEEAYKSGEKKVFSYLVKNNKYYFPVVVSGREVAVVEIVKNAEGYRVFCVTAGPVSDNFIKEKKALNSDNAKYVTETTIINGFVVSNGAEEFFIDLDRADVAGNAYNTKTNEESVAKEFLSRRGKEEETLRYGGGTAENNMKMGTFVSAIVLAMVLGVFMYILIKRKRVNK